MSIADSLKLAYVSTFPGEVARFVEKSPERIADIADLPPAGLNDFLDRVDPSRLRALFLKFPLATQIAVLESATVRLSLLILRTLEEAERDALLKNLDGLTRDELSKLLTFPQGSAGYYMDQPSSQYETGDTVSEALEKLNGSNHTRVRSVYITDDDNVLVGRVDMQDMALAAKDTRLSSLVHPVEGVVNLTSPREELLEIFARTRMDSVPVLDVESRLIGIVRYGSLFQAAEDEATASMQKMVGASVDERALSSPFFAVRKRLPWLHINLLTAFLAAAVVGLFESTIAQFTALAILLPVVAGQSGNAGSQALAVTMRGLALKEVNVLQWRAVLRKEMMVGIIDGIALAITCGLGVLVWSGSFGLALVIGIAMIVSMIAAGISGALVPMALLRAGQDPATASSIILTTVTDVAGFMSFLGTATLLAFML